MPETAARPADRPRGDSCTAVAFAAMRHGRAGAVPKGRRGVRSSPTRQLAFPAQKRCERDGRCETERCRGTLSVASSEGANRVPFGGRFGEKKLKPGKYQATVMATDSASQQSAPVTVRFRIVRR